MCGVKGKEAQAAISALRKWDRKTASGLRPVWSI